MITAKVSTPQVWQCYTEGTRLLADLRIADTFRRELGLFLATVARHSSEIRSFTTDSDPLLAARALKTWLAVEIPQAGELLGLLLDAPPVTRRMCYRRLRKHPAPGLADALIGMSATGPPDHTINGECAASVTNVKFYVRTVLGSLISLCALGVFVFGIYYVARGGTCASGGAYVSTKQCAAGSTEWMFALPPVLLLGLYGLWLVKMRGPQPGAAQPGPSPAAPGLPGHVTRLDQAAFIEGLIADSSLVFTTSAPQAADMDPIARIERLQSLLKAGALSPEEFQRAKAKILEEM